MRLWQGILASVAVHAALFQIPVGLSAPREPECVEVQLVLEAAPAVSARTPDPIVISLTREGEIFIGDQPVSLEDLPAAVQSGLMLQPEPSVKIRADQEASVGLLIKVVDGVRMAGCPAFSIVTEKP